MVDLQSFCPKNAWRQWMEKPFSRCDHTWATDGKILVRVPRVADVEEHPQAAAVAAVESVWPKEWPTEWRQPLRRTLPRSVMERCDECSGRGRKHKCPDCQCVCHGCDGEGQNEVLQAVIVGLRAIPLRHARQLITLEWIEISPPAKADLLLCFRFEGGEGIVSILKAEHELEVVGEI